MLLELVVAVDTVVALLLLDDEDIVDDVDARQGEPRAKCRKSAFVVLTSTLASKIWQRFFCVLYEKAPHSTQGDEVRESHSSLNFRQRSAQSSTVVLGESSSRR